MTQMRTRSFNSGRDRISTLFEPDVLLPAQFLPQRAVSDTSPERRLLLAILVSAYEDVIKYGKWRERSAGALARDAIAWIESPDTDPYSFIHACEALDLDADYIRGGVRRSLTTPLPAAILTPDPPLAPGRQKGSAADAQRVREARDRLGLTGVELSRQVGAGSCWASQIEARRRPLSAFMAQRLAALEVGTA